MKRTGAPAAWKRTVPCLLIGCLLASVAALGAWRAEAQEAAGRAPSKPTAAMHPADQTIKLDPKGPGRVFDGVGAISSSSSLLLYDYPEPQRGQILDYLFKPNYGAALQIFKIEIGADTNSTAAAEPSHMRTPTDLNCHRGIEWWMAKEARQRNPNIKLYGLMWGAPGWFKDGKLWGDDHVRYLMSWLGCAKENGLQIDYLGGGNERGDPPPPVSFFVTLSKAVKAVYPNIKIIGTDEHAPPAYWHFATEMKANTAFRDAVDVLGEHDVCHWRSRYKHCDATLDARTLGKPIWNNEQSTQDAASGAEPLARAMNRNYIDAQLTGNINWAVIAAFYGNTGTGGQGLVVAESPWSGAYQVSKSVWVDAHTTQFAQPGWRYLDLASTYLTEDGSFVTMYSPKTGDYTIVIETADQVVNETVRFVPQAGLSMAKVNLWTTDLGSSNPADWFVQGGTMAAGRGGFQLTLKPHHLYTLSTTTGQHRGDAASPMGAANDASPYVQGSLALPYREDFEHVDATRRARFYQDQAGAFEAQPCLGGRAGTCYQQMVHQQPVLWHNGGKLPSTLVGDPGWWGDYEVSTEVFLPEHGYAELLGRIEQYNHNVISGYHFRVADEGTWQLYSEDTVEKEAASLGFESLNEQTRLAGGKASFAMNAWHRMSLKFEGDKLTVLLDGKQLASIHDDKHRTGQAGLLVSPWVGAQFDDVKVERTRPWPVFAPHALMSATATSSQPGVYQHRFYTPGEAIDGRFESRWSSQFLPLLEMPQALTLDLGKEYTSTGLSYEPPADTGRGGRITEYVLSVSSDGTMFKEVARGRWSGNVATKTAEWPAAAGTRFVRLQALATAGSGAGATEVNVMVQGSK